MSTQTAWDNGVDQMTANVASNRSAPPGDGAVHGAVRSWLRLEGLAAFSAGVVLFGVSGGNWLFILPLVLLPDVSAVGYLAGPRVGAFTYNLLHTWAPGFIALALGVWLAAPPILLVASMLIAHVGMDRALGYGLKMPTSFQETHLGRIGRGSRRATPANA